MLPRGYVAQPEAWRLSYDRRPATAMVHECGLPGGRATYLSRDAACGGDVPMGPVGWISRIPRQGWTPLVACHGSDATTVRSGLRCDDGDRRDLLGWAEPVAATSVAG